MQNERFFPPDSRLDIDFVNVDNSQIIFFELLANVSSHNGGGALGISQTLLWHPSYTAVRHKR